jgi:hypothetical protein
MQKRIIGCERVCAPDRSGHQRAPVHRLTGETPT